MPTAPPSVETENSVESCQGPFTPVYNWKDTPGNKIRAIAEKVYGAESVKFTSEANAKLRKVKKLGLNHLPICMAKTQSSLSDNPKLIGRPEGFELTVRDVEIAAGAGFIIPITGTIMRMPGLPSIPSSEGIDIDNEGNITGLS